MASPITINGAIIQYAFIDRINTVSKKYSFSALIPWDENCPQCQAIINASNTEWAKVSGGAKKAQSMGWMHLAANDTAHIHPDVMKLLDPNRTYLQVRPVQDENTTTPIALYDTVPNLIGNRSIVGNGTIANFKAVAYGYDSAGQKGVKYYAQWLQITHLVENTNANTGPGAADAPGGYVADTAALTPTIPPVVHQPVVQQQAMPDVNVMPAAPSTIPGMPAQPTYAAPAAQPVMTPAQPVYAAPAAQPVYAAPAQPVMTPAPVAQPVMDQNAYAAPVAQPVMDPAAQPVYAAPAPAAPIAPTAPAPIAQPVYAAPGMPVAPGMPQ